ncbi:uncharacterized protein LOC110262644 [Arachis ipaensis]|nr:uncharacterized protein LOC110262644 [Arachis ipaensis]
MFVHAVLRMISKEQSWKKNQQMKLTCLHFRVTYVVMIGIMLVIAGKFLMEITLESEASIFALTSPRFPPENICWILLLLIGSSLKDSKRMDHVAKRQGCATQVASEKGFFSIIFNLQVPGSTHYSMVFYFVTKELVPGSLLQRFVDGDDEFRNSRLKLIPSVPKGS